jgi:hypothetical protein
LRVCVSKDWLNAVRDLRRELLREIEQLTAKVKKLEARQGRQSSRESGEFKFAHERDDVEATAESVDLPKFLPPVLHKTTIN